MLMQPILGEYLMVPRVFNNVNCDDVYGFRFSSQTKQYKIVGTLRRSVFYPKMNTVRTGLWL